MTKTLIVFDLISLDVMRVSSKKVLITRHYSCFKTQYTTRKTKRFSKKEIYRWCHLYQSFRRKKYADINMKKKNI